MKSLWLCLILLSFSVQGANIQLVEFDQLKLSDFLGSLPASVSIKTIRKIKLPQPSTEARTKFPKTRSAFNIDCVRTFYNNSPYPSFGTCVLEVDLNDPSVSHINDEIKVIIPKNLAQAVYANIAYGIPRRTYYSYSKSVGTTFEGESGNIFHYQFSCTPQDCFMKISAAKLH